MAVYWLVYGIDYDRNVWCVFIIGSCNVLYGFELTHKRNIRSLDKFMPK